MVPKTSIPGGPPGQRPTAVLEPEPPAPELTKPDVRPPAFPRFTPDADANDFPYFADLLKMVKEEVKADYAGWWRFRADWENSDLSRMPKPGVNSIDFYGELRGVLLVGKPEMIGDTEEWPVELPNVATVSPANVTDPQMLPHLLALLYTRCMNRCMRGFVGNRKCSAEELPSIKADDFLGTHGPSAQSSKEAAGEMMQSDIDRQIRVALKAAGVTEHFLTLRFHAVLGRLQPNEPVAILRTLRQMTNHEYRAQLLQELLQKHGAEEYAQSVLEPEAPAEPAPAESARKTPPRKAPKKEPENVVKVEPPPASGNGNTPVAAPTAPIPPPPVPSAAPHRGGFFGGQRI